MPERFVKGAREVVELAMQEAQGSASPSIEAEHLLLALTRDRGIAGRVLGEAGLDHAHALSALDKEFELSLADVGVSLDAMDLPQARPLPGRPRWGTSAKLALTRAVEVAKDRGDRRIGSAHVLIGVLVAQEGTVSRAVRRAGSDPEGLIRAAAHRVSST
jgi:ATP-dependent Clp protease ATP-binding subunit ClpA